MSTHTLKFTHAATTRLLSLPATPIPTFQTLATAVQERFDLPTAPSALIYNDEDEDEITLSSDVEVAELWTYFSSAEGREGFEVRRFAVVISEESTTTETDPEKKQELLDSIQQALKADPSLVGPIHGLLHEALGKSYGGRRGGKHGHHRHPSGPHGSRGGRGGQHHHRGRWEIRELSDSEESSSSDEDGKKREKKCKPRKHRGPPPPSHFPHPGFLGFGPPPPPPPHPFGGRHHHHHHFGPPPPFPPGFDAHPSPFGGAPPPPPPPHFHGFGKHHGGKHGHGHGPYCPPPPPPPKASWGFGAGAELDPESEGFEAPPPHGGPFGFSGGHGGFGGRGGRGGRRGRGVWRERQEGEQEGLGEQEEWVFFA